MKVLIIGKYPPIQGGVSTDTYWTAQALAELGYEVCVLTNSDEVESEYRLDLLEADRILLSGFRKRGVIRVVSTKQDPRHVYVPFGNPSISKLMGLGLSLIEECRPDFIWSYYLEPYGVVAMMLSMLTKVPYVVRHAGSDFGRLILTEQLRPIYEEVFKRATLVYSRELHYERLQKMGVDLSLVRRPVTLRLPGDLFYQDESIPKTRNRILLGIYGKTGPTKGTPELLQALALLRKQEFPLTVKALWGGRHLAEMRSMIQELELEEPFAGKMPILQVCNFIPHWRIPDFIRSCHGMLFLENGFRIAFHTPGVPAEVNSCGRWVLLTQEIAQKQHVAPFLKEGVNSCVIPSSVAERLDVDSLAGSIRSFAEHVSKDPIVPREECLDASLYSVRSRIRLQENLKEILVLL